MLWGDCALFYGGSPAVNHEPFEEQEMFIICLCSFSVDALWCARSGTRAPSHSCVTVCPYVIAVVLIRVSGVMAACIEGDSNICGNERVCLAGCV